MDQPTPAVLKSALGTQIEDELRTYLNGIVNLSEGVDYSEKELKRRIALFELQTYPTGKFDTMGNYKYWFNIITPRVEAEIKNIDFDTKDITVYSDRKVDELPCIIMNLKMKEWLRDNGEDQEINSAIEEGAGWGNVVWKKLHGKYERVDMKNFYVINQTVQTLDESPVIERHQYTASDLRAMSKKWKYVKETLASCKNDSYSTTIETTQKDTTVPYYEIYERNGEVKLSDLLQQQADLNGTEYIMKEGDDETYVLARVVAAGVKAQGSAMAIKYILFAQQLSGKMSDYYKEYHRSRYKNRWFREGLIELLFDLQVRANAIGNQIAQGLEFASKVIFSSSDKLIVQNILTDLRNGDIIRTNNISQVMVSMQGFNDLVADWNRIIDLADSISNASAIIMGEVSNQHMAFKLGALEAQNAMKLYEFVRQKLGIVYSQIFKEWIIPKMVKDLSSQEVMRITGDSDMLERLYQVIVNDWYIRNLVAIGVHSPDEAAAMQAQKMDELKKRPQLLLKDFQLLFADFEPNVTIIITGENTTLAADMSTLQQFIALETDPVRRTALIELAMKKAGMDVGALPKTQGQGLNPGEAPNNGAPAGQPANPNANQPVKPAKTQQTKSQPTQKTAAAMSGAAGQPGSRIQ